MFWTHPDLQEEEWSLSAKVFAGLVLNPFALTNQGNDSLFRWFFRHVTATASGCPECWSAQPEYAPMATGGGRNDWRLYCDGWTIAVECKFGDGLDIPKDCQQYLRSLPRDNRRLVLVATVSEFSELTLRCAHLGDTADDVRFLKQAVQKGDVIFLSWHELVDEAAKRLPERQATVLMQWARAARRRVGLPLMSSQHVTGREIASMILKGKAAEIPILHAKDRRSDRKPTASLEQVFLVTDTPSWARDCLLAVQSECESTGLTFEEIASGWVNVRRNRSSPSITLIPWKTGLAAVLSHPRRGRHYPEMKKLVNLEVYKSHSRLAKEPPQHFPKDRALGIEYTSAKPISPDEFVAIVLELATGA